MNHVRLVIVAVLLPLLLVVSCSRRHPPTPTPPPGPVPVSVPVPAKFVGGYLESWAPLLPRNLPAGYTLLFSAFATIDSSGSVTYQPDRDGAALTVDIGARKVAQHPVILSVGGSEGSKSGLGTASQQQAFLSSVMPIIDTYGFSGIDWDIESGVPISVTGLAAVSRALVSHYGRTFAITLAPYHSTAAVLKQLAQRIKDIVTFVGFQFYNNDSAPTPDSVVAEMDSWIAQCGISPSQFSLGFMPQDENGNVTSYATMVSIYNQVRQKYPTVRGVWIWAIGSDQDNGYKFVDTLASVVRG
jgi:chitinase